jgi:hypothetical protein
MDEATAALGHAATRALLGVDALYRAESGDRDGLAVLNLDLQGRLQPEPFASYEAARGRFRALLVEAAGLVEPDRRRYYDRLCRSTLAFIRWRMIGLPFENSSRTSCTSPPAPRRAPSWTRCATT